MTPTCPPDLREHYRAGRLILFVGAGASASISWTDAGGAVHSPPTWRELVDHAARELGFVDPDLLRVRGTDLQILEYFDAVRGGIDILANWLVRKLAVPEATLRASRIHAELAAMANCPLVYTTNYDGLIEAAFALHRRESVVLARELDFASAFSPASGAPPPCQIVKFHGDLTARETMVVTESHYQERLKLVTAMDLRLRSDLLGRAVLFIGYSFRDPNVSYLFNLVNEEFEGLPASRYGRRAFIAVPDPSQFEQRLFQERRIDVVALDSGDMVGEIAELLRLVRG